MDEPSQLPAAITGLNPGTLIASLIWGAIGAGFFIYGKKQRSAPSLFGGILNGGRFLFHRLGPLDERRLGGDHRWNLLLVAPRLRRCTYA